MTVNNSPAVLRPCQLAYTADAVSGLPTATNRLRFALHID